LAVVDRKLTAAENRVLLSNLKQVMDKIDQVVIKVIKNPKAKKVLLHQNRKMVVDVNKIV
jgi:hypothetical protein